MEIKIPDKITTNTDKSKLYKIAFIFMFVVIAIIILIWIISSLSGGKISLEEFPSELKEASIDYYDINKKELPKKNEIVSITYDKLVTEGYIKEFEELVDTESTCSASVNVENNNGNYLYTPIVNCGNDYNTTTLVDKILKDNKIVTEGEGLYQDGENYVFKGEKVNNHVSFNNQDWLIVRINSDKTIRLVKIPSEHDEMDVWDDRYNIETEDTDGINDYEKSRVKEIIEEVYKSYKSDVKAFIVNHDVCADKFNENTSINDAKNSCNTIINNQKVSLLNAYEGPYASIDKNCTNLNSLSCMNYNYFSHNGIGTWTVNSLNASSYQSFEISSGVVYSNDDSADNYAAIVVHISSNTLYSSGKGTYNKPYIIK